MVLLETNKRYGNISAVALAVLMAVYCFMPVKTLAHGEDNNTKQEQNVNAEKSERHSERRVLDMNSCVSCHKETYSIARLLELSKEKKNDEWKCRGPIGEVVERNRHLRGAIKRVDSISESVFGNYYKSLGDGVAEYGNSSESEIMKILFEKISELKENHENYLQQKVENVKTGEKECDVIEDEAIDIYGSVNEVFMQRRLRNILITVTLACFVFIFSVIIGFRKMLPSGERGVRGEKGEQDGDKNV